MPEMYAGERRVAHHEEAPGLCTVQLGPSALGSQ